MSAEFKKIMTNFPISKNGDRYVGWEYGNVTRREGESRYMVQGKPETVPDVKKIIRD